MHHRRHRRHRRRPRRPGRQPAAHRRRPRPRRPRPRSGRRALAHRALGLPAPADAELDDPAAGLELRRARPRRLPQRRRARRPPRAVRRLVRRAGRRGHDGATVSATRDDRGRYRVVADRGTWRARHVVIATGPHGTPHVPGGRACAGVDVLTANQLPQPRPARPAAACWSSAPRPPGVQIADELNRAGREVVLAVGRHTRMPRRYRGMDIFWWLERTGRLARTIDDVSDPAAARREPSLQLVGRSDPDGRRPDLDLGVLQARGVRLAGRLEAVTGRRSRSATTWPISVAAADASMHRFLDAVDALRRARRPRARGVAGTRPRPDRGPGARSGLDLRARGHRHGAASRPATARTTRGCGCRSRARTGASASTAASPPRRGCTSSASGSSTGATRAMIDGARHDAHDVVEPPARPSGPTAGSRARSRRMTRLRRGRRRRPGGRRLDGDAARPGRRPGRSRRPRPSRQPTPCPRTA